MNNKVVKMDLNTVVVDAELGSLASMQHQQQERAHVHSPT